ncbi:MAG: hypothetical protein P8Y99_13175, partial [Calditrichaceae bacterium]
MLRKSILLLIWGCIPCLVLAQEKDVPDWALPGSETHQQVSPPEDFHRPARTVLEPIGIFEGQSDIGAALIPGSSSYDVT